MASWWEPPRPRRERPAPSRTGDLWIIAASIVACAAICLLTPAPASGPAQPPRDALRATRLTTIAGPEPSSLAAVGATDGHATTREPAGRRPGALQTFALLAGISLVFWLLADDLLSIDRKPEDQSSEARPTTKETERSAC